jgi:PAS domain-containing protein
MSKNDIEVILAQQLSDYLAMPIFIIDPSGDLLFFNESAEVILGCQYHEIETMPASEWSTVFAPVDQEGRPLKLEELPLMITMT